MAYRVQVIQINRTHDGWGVSTVVSREGPQRRDRTLMTRVVEVTSTQVLAAQLKVKLAAHWGEPVSRGVLAIANARRADAPPEEQPPPDQGAADS